MKQTLTIRELAVVVAARNHNPTILNPDFLKYNGIVGQDWKLAEDPICVGPFAHVSFENGVNIIAELGKVSFSQTLADKQLADIVVADIARDYVKTLPHVEYRAVGINPKGDIPISDDEKAGFRTERLILPGPWTQFNECPAEIGIRFVYRMGEDLLNLTIEPMIRSTSDGDQGHILIFAANFHHEVSGSDPGVRLERTIAVIAKWKDLVESYRRFVDESLLKETLE